MLEHLVNIWRDEAKAFLVYDNKEYFFQDILDAKKTIDLSSIKSGDVVALIGDFNPQSIMTLILLVEKNAIIMPLTISTRVQHDDFFMNGLVDVIIENNKIIRRKHQQKHELIEKLRTANKPGLILFSSGITGKPKAILHDVSLFLKKYNKPRPILITLSFLLFDHIGGINTLLHSLFNQNLIVAPSQRSIDHIINLCKKYNVENMPVSPTFMRMLLLSSDFPKNFPPSIKIITYGTEKMDQATLNKFHKNLPQVKLKQTYGASEIGILSTKSESDDSLYMKIGGEAVETKIINKILYIKNPNCMMGYINAPSPFDKDGFYNTHDIVEEKNGYIKILGRDNEVINVGGIKFLASQVEDILMLHPKISMVKVFAETNPIVGQHIAVTVNYKNNETPDKKHLLEYCKINMPPQMVPHRFYFNDINISHRFKKL
ncbi:MAG: ANL family adenylate-forming protein [Alphaproteobacteria bacterium]